MDKSDDLTRLSEVRANLPGLADEIESILSDDVVEEITRKLSMRPESTKLNKSGKLFRDGLLIRYLLSCLLDGDRLDTADFEMPGNAAVRNYGRYRSWRELIDRLDVRLAEYEAKPDKNQVEILRAHVSQNCLMAAQRTQGIFQLTVPTGGGKTLSSLRFGLHHAHKWGLDRIIYVVPFTTIIDQNADEIRKILEDKNDAGTYLDKIVLEHHSNLTPEEETQRQNLLAQNWDAPIVLTTQVQFLEALFGAGTRSARRMHQLARSVIILDEAQAFPIRAIHMLNGALDFLVQDCGSSVVLCTATQPPLHEIPDEFRSLILHANSRIIEDEQSLFHQLKRVEVRDCCKPGGWDVEEIATLAEEQLIAAHSVLVVVNTKRSALELFKTLSERGIAAEKIFHLSTSMCPAHRREVLEKVKERLTPGSEQPVICISTQLIEAGVDIDFAVAIRYLAGMDSIAQAAGRCNRHGRREGLGKVFIVNPAEESLGNLEDIKIGIQNAERVLDDYKRSPEAFDDSRIGLASMRRYYDLYYHNRQGDMKYPIPKESELDRDDDLFTLLSLNTHSAYAYKRAEGKFPAIDFPQSFQTAARLFRPIDSATQGVVVPYGAEGRQLVSELQTAHELDKQTNLLKAAQKFSVNLFVHECLQLVQEGIIQQAQPGVMVFVLDPRHYSGFFGWSKEPVEKMELLLY
jgi:CRISPR-associated endonuclease/helicase Cas3